MREQGIVSSQQINILEQQISAKDEELRTLQDAYRTKLKKMEAWENVNAIFTLIASFTKLYSPFI